MCWLTFGIKGQRLRSPQAMTRKTGWIEYIRNLGLMELDGLPSRFCFSCDLDLWPFDLISMSQAQIHTWPNFGENIYEDIVFTRLFGSLLAVTLTFDHWSQKLIKTSTNQVPQWPRLGKIPFIRFYPNLTTLRSGLCYGTKSVCLSVVCL